MRPRIYLFYTQGGVMRVPGAIVSVLIAALALFAIAYAGSENQKACAKHAEDRVLERLGVSRAMYDSWQDATDDRIFAFTHGWQTVDGRPITDDPLQFEDLHMDGQQPVPFQRRD